MRLLKGLALDEQNKAKRSRVSRKINFESEINTESTKQPEKNQVNTNRNASRSRSKQVTQNKVFPTRGKESKQLSDCYKEKSTKPLLHNCFVNVWNKEIGEEINREEVAKSIQKNMNKGKNRSKFQVNQDDGINLDVESGADLDELDYVDDMIDDELSILEEEELQNTHEDVEVNQRNALPLVTQQTTSGKRVDGLVRISTGQEPKGIVIANKTKVSHDVALPGTSKADNEQIGRMSHSRTAEQLTDEELASMPRVKKLFNQFWDEKMKQMENDKGEPVNRKSINAVHNSQTIKSPSDTTIYVPGLRKSGEIQMKDNAINLHQAMVGCPEGLVIATEEAAALINDMISDFVDNVRLENESRELMMEKARRRSSTGPDERDRTLEEVKRRGKKSVQEAEKFEASIAVPKPGEPNNKLPVNQVFNIQDIGSGVSDDDFFHLTCHIDPGLIHKIETGEFVELEKLLPKDKGSNLGNENRLEWVHRDGGTFLVPAQKDTKINSFRKWEQAFRAYATIYCGANPHRGKEIWQYITVINTAASSFIWNNVYNYDITFRHLMAFNPNRSWAITYNQMWNLSMRDPLPKSFGQKQNNNQFAHERSQLHRLIQRIEESM